MKPATLDKCLETLTLEMGNVDRNQNKMPSVGHEIHNIDLKASISYFCKTKCQSWLVSIVHNHTMPWRNTIAFTNSELVA